MTSSSNKNIICVVFIVINYVDSTKAYPLPISYSYDAVLNGDPVTLISCKKYISTVANIGQETNI